MSLGKLGMMLLLEYRQQFHAVKDHLSRSAVELIKAMEETLKIAQKSGEHLSLHPLQSSLVNKAFAPLELILRYSEEVARRATPESTQEKDHPLHIPTASQLPAHELKSHIIQSLIDALDAEMAKTSAEEAMRNPFKIKALESVKRVLLEQDPNSTSTADTENADTPSPAETENDEVQRDEDVVIALHRHSTPADAAPSPWSEESPLDIREFRRVRTA